MNNSHGADQWRHYQDNPKYRTDIQQRQKQERDRQRAAYEARAAASQSQTTTPDADMASHQFAHMDLNGYGPATAGTSNTINRTEDGLFVKENIKYRDAHRRGASDNAPRARENTRPSSSASSKGSLFSGLSFSRTGTSSSSHKHSSSEDTEQRRRSSIKEKVQDVYRRMSNSYNNATDTLSKAVDPYVNIAKLNANERQRWEAELRQEIEDAEEEKRRSDVSSNPVSYHSQYPTTPSPRPARSSAHSNGSYDSYSTDSYQPAAPKPKKSKDLLTPGERAAVFVSKIVDPVKKRRDSDDSDLSFADIAPPAEMDACSRCGEVVTGFLVKGRCHTCYGLWLQGPEFWDASDCPAVSSQTYDPEDTNSDYSNRSSSSSPSAARDINEEDYMKLTASHRIRRVRQTTYDDPGNPFALVDYASDDSVPNEVVNVIYDPDAIPSMLKRLSDAVAESPPPGSPESFGPNPFEEQATHHHELDFIMLEPTSPITNMPGTLSSKVYKQSVVSNPAPEPEPNPDSPIFLGPNPFEERPSLNASREPSPLLAPTPCRSGTPALIRDQSIPGPTPPPKDEKFRMILSGSVRRVVQRSQAHKRSETMPNGSERTNRVGVGGVERDTRFYGFWDDVLVEYGSGRKL